eukprot:365775-Chlamydomonas_euryale.AAC.6
MQKVAFSFAMLVALSILHASHKDVCRAWCVTDVWRWMCGSGCAAAAFAPPSTADLLGANGP